MSLSAIAATAAAAAAAECTSTIIDASKTAGIRTAETRCRRRHCCGRCGKHVETGVDFRLSGRRESKTTVIVVGNTTMKSATTVPVTTTVVILLACFITIDVVVDIDVVATSSARGTAAEAKRANRCAQRRAGTQERSTRSLLARGGVDIDAAK